MSLAVQWLGLHAFTSVGTGSIHGQDRTCYAKSPKNKFCFNHKKISERMDVMHAYCGRNENIDE